MRSAMFPAVAIASWSGAAGSTTCLHTVQPLRATNYEIKLDRAKSVHPAYDTQGIGQVAWAKSISLDGNAKIVDVIIKAFGPYTIVTNDGTETDISFPPMPTLSTNWPGLRIIASRCRGKHNTPDTAESASYKLISRDTSNTYSVWSRDESEKPTVIVRGKLLDPKRVVGVLPYKVESALLNQDYHGATISIVGWSRISPQRITIFSIVYPIRLLGE